MMVANIKKFNVEVKGNPLNSPLFTPPPRQVQHLFSLPQTVESKLCLWRSSYVLVNVSIIPPWLCAKILLSSAMLVVKSQRKLSGFKTHGCTSGAYQSVKPDNHNTIISKLRLLISLWFCIVGWMRKYNTLFRGIAHAVSSVAVLNLPTFKETTLGAKKMAVKYYCSPRSRVTLSTRIICNHMGVRYGFA